MVEALCRSEGADFPREPPGVRGRRLYGGRRTGDSIVERAVVVSWCGVVGRSTSRGSPFHHRLLTVAPARPLWPPRTPGRVGVVAWPLGCAAAGWGRAGGAWSARVS